MSALYMQAAMFNATPVANMFWQAVITALWLAPACVHVAALI